MESQKVVEVELEEIALVEEHKERENEDEQETKADTEEKTADEGNVYSALTEPSEYVYGVPSSTRFYTVNKDASDIYRRVRVYRVVSLVLFVICVLLLIVVLVLFIKLTGMHACQLTETTLEQECSLKKCQDVYQQPFERAQGLCRDCGRGWLRFENTCYFLSQTRLTWQKSREECQRNGGDLAVITNERVQMFLSKRAILHYWIGLSHVGTNQWMWINNTVLTVRYWGDSSSSGECAILAAEEPAERSWQPESCRLNLQYICQKM